MMILALFAAFGAGIIVGYVLAVVKLGVLG
jgi:hypothetical protein